MKEGSSELRVGLLSLGLEWTICRYRQFIGEQVLGCCMVCVDRGNRDEWMCFDLPGMPNLEQQYKYFVVPSHLVRS